MSSQYRLATGPEIELFTTRIYPLQDRILQVAATFGDALVLTGGTALAREYFAHRLSDDLELFTSRPMAGLLGRDFANALHRSGIRRTSRYRVRKFFPGDRYVRRR